MIAASSRAAATGEVTRRPAFWSQAVASMLAATVAGSEPPMTKPKKRGPARGHRRRRARLVEQREHPLGGEAALGQGRRQAREAGEGFWRGSHGSLLHLGQVARRAGSGVGEQGRGIRLVHGGLRKPGFYGFGSKASGRSTSAVESPGRRPSKQQQNVAFASSTCVNRPLKRGYVTGVR